MQVLPAAEDFLTTYLTESLDGFRYPKKINQPLAQFRYILLHA
jgi:hypothetical protein